MNSNEPSSAIVGGFEDTLREQASTLKDLVDKGDLSGALTVISQLNETRDRTLYLEVGKLTRSLHEAIRNFNIDSNDQVSQEDLSEINDASDRLAYVVELTNKAANKTLDLVEESMPLADQLRKEADEFKNEWSRLKRKEMSPAEFRDLSSKLDVFFGRLCDDSEKVYQNLSEILLAQDYQDLTGQVINRVTGLVKDVEVNLVNLVRMAGKVDQITGTVHETEQQKEEVISKGEGPQMQADVREDVVSGQDDVDDLLSSLGF